MRIEQSLEELVRDHVRVRESEAIAAQALFTWCCERLRANTSIVEIIPSGSFARGTCIRPLHDIDALVRFDLRRLRDAGVHDGTNLMLLFLGDVLKCLAPQHQISDQGEWSYVAQVDGKEISLRRQGCSVGVCMGGRWSDEAITFDFVPCVEVDDAIAIIHRVAGRVRTSPGAARDVVEELDRKLGGAFRTVVQLAKHWNARSVIPVGETGAPSRPFKSFHLELLCCELGREYVRSFDGSPPETGAPLLHEVMTDLFTFLRMNHRCDLQVPGVPGERLQAVPSLRGEIERALCQASVSLTRARCAIVAGDADAAAEHWREVLGDRFQLSSSPDYEQHLPRWQLSAARNASRGPLLRAAEAGEVDGSLELAAAPASDGRAALAVIVASALDHGRVLEELLRGHAVSSATLIEATVAAARNDCRSALEVLLACGATGTGAIASIPEASRPLVIASHYASADVVARLLAAGIPADGALAAGTTSLMAAAASGNEPVVALLLKAGAAVEAVDAAGRTALFFACENGHAGVAAALLREGASPTRKTRDGYCPLYVACAGGHRRVVETLMARSEVRAAADDSAPDRHTALVIAACRSSYGVVEALLEHPDVDVDAYCEAGWTALGFAAQEGNLEIVRLLLRRGAAVDAPRTRTVMEEEAGGTPLISAASNGHIEVVRLLLAHGADVNYVTPGYSASVLNVVVKSGHLEIVELLLDAGADVDQHAKPPFSSPFHAACLADRPRIAELLLDRGADAGVVVDGIGAALCAYHHDWPRPLLARILERTTDVAVLGLVLAKASLERCHEVAGMAVAAWKKHAGVTDSWLLSCHIGVSCDRCKATPIVGARHHCARCDEFDVCSRCLAEGIEVNEDGCRHELVELAPDSFLAEVLGATTAVHFD